MGVLQMGQKNVLYFETLLNCYFIKNDSGVGWYLVGAKASAVFGKKSFTLSFISMGVIQMRQKNVLYFETLLGNTASVIHVVRVNLCSD